MRAPPIHRRDSSSPEAYNPELRAICSFPWGLSQSKTVLGQPYFRLLDRPVDISRVAGQIRDGQSTGYSDWLCQVMRRTQRAPFNGDLLDRSARLISKTARSMVPG